MSAASPPRVVTDPPRPTRTARRQAYRELRKQQRRQGLVPKPWVGQPNRMCDYRTVDEERTAREEATLAHVQVIRTQLPRLLHRLSKIRDPRQPRKIKHRLALVLLYGIFMFVFQVASRRQANRTMTRPVFLDQLRMLFPELETIPHQETLQRVLARIEVERLEETLVEMVRDLIRRKKFRRYLVEDCYPIAIDGTQKLKLDWRPDDHWQKRRVGSGESATLQYYVYVVEANLAFRNGLTIPLMSEFTDAIAEGDEQKKQDCELKAFYRLSDRLKKAFPRLKAMLLLDGLYPNGPVMARCRKFGWDFMIVLKDDSLPQVWCEVEALLRLTPETTLTHRWGDRTQRFYWVNQITYWYIQAQQKKLPVHVAICKESWQTIEKDSTRVVERRSKHVWISSEPLHRANVVRRCNLGGRNRWSIESSILVEKRCGYHYEHCFSSNWNALRGYHYLMRIAHALNVLAEHSTLLRRTIRSLGVQAFIRFVLDTISGPWLDPTRTRDWLSRTPQLRLR